MAIEADSATHQEKVDPGLKPFTRGGAGEKRAEQLNLGRDVGLELRLGQVEIPPRDELPNEKGVALDRGILL